MNDLAFIRAVHPKDGEMLFVRPAGRQAEYGSDPDDAGARESDPELARRMLKEFREGMHGTFGYVPVAMDIVWTDSRDQFTSPILKPLSYYEEESQ